MTKKGRQSIKERKDNLRERPFEETDLRYVKWISLNAFQENKSVGHVEIKRSKNKVNDKK
jgi:hypothetical protein